TLDTATAKFDLTLSLTERPGGGLHGRAEYATDLFDGSTVVTLIRMWRQVLDAVAADPGTRVDELTLVTGDDPDQTAETGMGLIVRLAVESLAGMVRRWPAMVPAVTAGERTWTYGELNAAASRLAWDLIGRGVGAEDVVALRMPRSAELVVALLAVSMTGAAFLPVDVDYPAE